MSGSLAEEGREGGRKGGGEGREGAGVKLAGSAANKRKKGTRMNSYLGPGCVC